MNKNSNIDFLILVATFMSALFVDIRIPALKISYYPLFFFIIIPRLIYLLKPFDLSKLKSSKQLKLYILFFLMLLTSVLLSTFKVLALKQFFKINLYLCYGFYSYAVFKNTNNFDKFKKIIIFTLALIALFGVIESMSPNMAIFEYLRPEGSLQVSPRISSLLQWPNQFGVLMGVALYLLPSFSTPYFILVPLFNYNLLASGSRNALIFYFLVLLILTTKKYYKYIVFTFITFIILIPINSIPRPIRSFNKIAPSIMKIKTEQNSKKFIEKIKDGGGKKPVDALRLRTVLWANGFIHSVKNLSIFFGVGPDNFRNVIAPKALPEKQGMKLHAHNFILNSFFEWGIIPFTIFLIFIFNLYKINSQLEFKNIFILFIFSQTFDCFTHDVFFMFTFITLIANSILPTLNLKKVYM